ncbi:related to DUF907 domain [Lecanosticta acicola]|uniref:Related to DUF907 domain n=1 Tax=Lecanosticta acicola TaxID=111012 RepID=A0AAI8Z473_9PEZI|nr:related to DUF907 domain [Lecanosticta acicola]
MRSLYRQLPLFLLSALPVGVLGGDILTTDGFSTCVSDPSIKVEALNVTYNRSNRKIIFDVAGSSAESQKVLLNLVVSAYGQQVYTKEYDPCDNATNMVDSTEAYSHMCPIPAGTFSSRGEQTIPEEYASKIPSIAFSVPDLDGLVKLEVKSEDGTKDLACITSTVGNGHTFNMPAISYAAAGVAAAALALSAAGALASAGAPGVSTPSPTFGEVIGWFQGMATNGMLSVQYPEVYRSFATNFAFSTGLLPWGQMQTAIDNFRNTTGGNLTDNNYYYLRNNATLVYDSGSTDSSSVSKRALNSILLWARDGTTTSVNGTDASTGSGASNSTSTSSSKDQHFVSGIQAYVEKLSIPSANTFMTVLLVWAIVVAAMIVLILLFKAILELWAQFSKLPKGLESWRKRYWWRMAKGITNLILLLYGVWVLYCVYQFKDGDSWAAKLLAGITLGLFTVLLAGFSWRIYAKAHQYKKLEGAPDKLYEDKETWIKYSLFYDNYKKSFWWLFVPAIVYMSARGAIIAGASGHGMVQASGQLIVEALMLIVLLWTRPYQRRSGKWINITIQSVRVISVVCVLIFVEELGISQTTKTITGVVLIVVQTTLTAVLALLIAINAIITCIKENPHTRARREAAKRNKDLDLTPLDARNSLLLDPMVQKDHGSTAYKAPLVASSPFADSRGRYDKVPYNTREDSPGGSGRYRDDEHLISSAAPFHRDLSQDRRNSVASHAHSRDHSVDSREPRLPDLNFGRAL